MNRKTKKQVKAVVVLLFFLVAGFWYFFSNEGFNKKQEDSTKLNSVLDTDGTEGLITQAAEPEDSRGNVLQPEEAIVYVCGAVNAPGIYTLAANSRLYEAIALAGGFSSEADPAYHNLARSIADGERIYILSVAETKVLSTEQQVSGEEGVQNASTGATALINLNTATAEQLMELPGIGESRAADILEYRKRIGQFTAIEEIMNVSGIGNAMFEKIKDKIIVK